MMNISRIILALPLLTTTALADPPPASATFEVNVVDGAGPTARTSRYVIPASRLEGGRVSLTDKDGAAGGQRQVLDAPLTIVGSRAGEDSLSFSVERELVSPAPPGPAGSADYRQRRRQRSDPTTRSMNRGPPRPGGPGWTMQPYGLSFPRLPFAPSA